MTEEIPAEVRVLGRPARVTITVDTGRPKEIRVLRLDLESGDAEQRQALARVNRALETQDFGDLTIKTQRLAVLLGDAERVVFRSIR